MSMTTVLILNAVLVAALVGGLAYVLRMPFRLDRTQPLAEPVSIERVESDRQAA